ncbi:retrovirus-related pol polyprotein from transposon TNT 1-94 [Tanacetum coccineum]
MASRGKKKSTPLLIPSIRFTKLIIHHLKTKHNIHPRIGSPLHYWHEDHILGILRSVGKDGREIFGMTIPDALLIDAIKRAPYYGEYLEHVAKYQQYLDEERGKAEEEAVTESPKATKVTKPKAAKQTMPSAPKAAKETPDEPSPVKRSKGGIVGKRRKSKSLLKLVDKFVDEGVPHKEPAYDDEESNLQWALELSLKDQGERTPGPARPVVFREPNSRRFQPLLERRTLMSTEPFGNAESPSLDVELALTDSEMEPDEEVPPVNPEKDASYKELTEINIGVQDEGQARPNPDK